MTTSCTKNSKPIRSRLPYKKQENFIPAYTFILTSKMYLNFAFARIFQHKKIFFALEYKYHGYQRTKPYLFECQPKGKRILNKR